MQRPIEHVANICSLYHYKIYTRVANIYAYTYTRPITYNTSRADNIDSDTQNATITAYMYEHMHRYAAATALYYTHRQHVLQQNCSLCRCTKAQCSLWSPYIYPIHLV